MTRRSYLRLAAAAVLLLLAIILSYRLWLPLFGRWLVVADPLPPAQAIVPLAGARERAGHAAKLYNEGHADWFVATNAPVTVPGIDESYSDLVRRAAARDGVPEERFLAIPELVHSTNDEARAIRRLAEERGWNSLIIVTSPYHTRRTRAIFGDVFRHSGIAVAVRPVEPDIYDGSAWWQDNDNLRNTVLEYLKLLAHNLGYQ